MVDRAEGWPTDWNTAPAFITPDADGRVGDGLETIFSPDERGWNMSPAFEPLSKPMPPIRLAEQQPNDSLEEPA